MKKNIIFGGLGPLFLIMFLATLGILYFNVFYSPEEKDRLMDKAYLWGFYPRIEPKTPDPVKPALENLISRYKNGQIDVVDISTITTFSWDRLYLTGPLGGPWDITHVVGRSWRMIDSCVYGSYKASNPEGGDTVLVFSEKGNVVYCSIYERRRLGVVFYISDSEYKEGFSPQEARFFLDRTTLKNINRK